MNALMLWFGAEPIAFRIVAYAALSAFLAMALRARGRTAAFLLLTAATVAVWRWPALMYPAPLNPDEAQVLANALKALVDPLPWRSFDPGTAGPLETYVLVLPALFGMQLDFLGARLVGIMLVIGSLWALFLAARWTYGEGIARLALVPPALFFAATTDPDFIHYSSEHLPIFLSMVGLASCAYLVRSREPDRSVIAAACGGFALGCVPFAKLQAVPVATVLVACLAIAIAMSGRARSEVRRAWAVALAALFAPTVIILGSVVAGGAWHDFVVSYLESSLSYVSGSAAGLGFYVSESLAFRTFLLGSLALAVAGAIVAVVRRAALTRTEVLGLASALLLTAASVFAVYEAHRAFMHYLLLLVFPIAWLIANVAAIVRRIVPPAWRDLPLSAAYTAPFVLGTIVLSVAAPNRFLELLASDARPARAPVVTAIERYAPPHTVIAIWGWMPEYYVESKTIMAPRDAVTVREVYDTPYRQYYRRRFMADLAARTPRVIVEAVGPNGGWFTDRATQGIESFPDFADLVRQRYALVDSLGGARIFVLKPDAAAVPASAARLVPPAAAPTLRDVSASCHGSMPQRVNSNGTVELAVDASPFSAVPDGTALQAGTGYRVAGWAIDPNGERLLSGVCLYVDGKLARYGKTLYGSPRPDIASAFKTDGVTASGYLIEIPARSLSPGRHELSVVTLTASGSALLLRAPRTVTVN
jgi:hypothetical protein